MAQEKSQKGNDKGKARRYIVIARVETEYEDCSVIPEDNVFPATHRKVFGPDTKQKCEDWKNQNCTESKE